MRISCNGCRVLRKGCNDNCSIRPCLQWIKTSDSQAHATVFLAKFYGRAGLMNLINAGPEHLRPAIFRSLLYEACGRIVNPIYGSVGLMWSGSWQLCQAAVEAVLNGSPIVQISSDAAASNPVPPFKAYDIRHVPKDHQHDIDAAGELHKVAKGSRSRFKRSAAKSQPTNIETFGIDWLGNRCSQPANSHSHESLGSREAAAGSGKCDGESKENESMVSIETMEASHVSQGEISNNESGLEEGDIDLALTLGCGIPVSRMEAPAAEFSDPSGLDAILDAKVSLGLELAA